jgi:protein PhnA
MYRMNVTDINGNSLQDGDSVKLTKDLKVKGAGITLKRGTVVKNIRITERLEKIDCKIKKANIVLRTEFDRKM